MRFSLSIVVDNIVPIGGGQPFLGEHGLSMLLETEGTRLLLDAGQSGTAVVNNLSLLGVPPASLSGVVLSHGHYDHCGGLAQVLAHAGKRLPVHVHGEISKRGVIDVLRKGVKHGPHHVDLFYGTPSPGNSNATRTWSADA